MQAREIAKGPFEPTWESLRRFQCPEWFRDAKFGIWSHWGPQSVPMYGDWYARRMYIQGEAQYRYHLRHYGHPSKFGYKDIVRLWKAENFDPEGLMDLYVAAGARYFFAQAAHHDNFHNWNSKHHRWNAVEVGPKKDIVGLWQAAAKRRGLPFGLSEHIATSYSWLTVDKDSDKTGPYAGVPYDGNDPAYEDLYLDNQGVPGLDKEWYTSDPRWHERWYAYVKDFIDQYHPDIVYSDGGVPFGQYGLDIIAHLYNTVPDSIYTQKDKTPEVFSVGVLDFERSQHPEIPPFVWQTDTSAGDWFYDVRDVYKTPKQVAEMLVDIVSKNGNLLLNVSQRPDGTIDDECTWLLERTGAWLKTVGEGIYGTRPWRCFGEGPSQVVIEGFREDAVDWTIEDFRFTSRGSTVFVFLMKWPAGGRAVVRSLAADPVESVELLGHGPVPFTRDARGLALDLPAQAPCDYAQCLKVSLAS